MGVPGPRLQLLHGMVHDIHQEVCICRVEAHGWLDAEDIAMQAPLAHQHPHVLHALKHLSQLSSSRSLQKQMSAGGLLDNRPHERIAEGQ